MSEVEFELRKLGDLIEIFNNKRVPLSAKQREGLEKIYPYYGAQGIVDYVDDYIFDGKYILIAEDGENLKSNNKSICTLATGKYWVNNHAHIIKGNEGTNTDFLYYKLNSINFAPYITGSAQPKLNKENLLNIELYIPSKEHQDKMAKVLTLLDQKIQINNQINQELEAMAKTIYDYWFVQFDFLDQNGKPYKSSGGKMVYNPELKREIPEGWGVEKLSSLLEIGRETINPMKTPKEEFKYYSIPEYDVSGSFSYELGETIRSNKFIVEKSDLLVSKLNPWFNRVVYNLEENAISSTEFIVWKTFNRFEKNFLYQVATSKEFIEYCTRFATGTSNSHKRVSPDIMVGFQIPFEKTYIQKFGEITDSIRTQVLQNNVQNQELTQLRDWLLPMLMNGQVKVE